MNLTLLAQDARSTTVGWQPVPGAACYALEWSDRMSDTVRFRTAGQTRDCRFRRGMGRQLLEANIPAPLICDILGHSSSVSLRQYTASSLEKLKVCAGTISAIPIAQEALL